MQQVSDWLEKLGLGQYAQRFAENDIDFALLVKLSDADLKELGVSSLGHRKWLLEAIGERTAPMPRAGRRRSANSLTDGSVTTGLQREGEPFLPQNGRIAQARGRSAQAVAGMNTAPGVLRAVL